MATNNLAVGDVVQIDPSVENFGACFMTVTEARTWGAQGYVRVPGGGDAYVRVNHKDMVLIGRVEWIRSNEAAQGDPQ